MRRQGNSPKRRIAPENHLGAGERERLAGTARYVGSGHHKRWPADYGLDRVGPRPNKSLCDMHRTISLSEAMRLLERGISQGMVSPLNESGFPKYIWCVDEQGEVYEAKSDVQNPGAYHGYRLEEDDNMYHVIKRAWSERCRQTGK